MVWPILSWLTGGLLESAGKAVTDVGKTFWGSQQERDAALSTEQIAILNQYAAEFAARQHRTWWDSFVDGLNRLVRPGLALGAQASFIWVWWDPVGFAECMRAMQLVPEMMWYLWLTIFAFYFGGRILEKAPKTWKVDPRALDLAKEIASERTARTAAVAQELRKEAAVVEKQAAEQKGIAAEKITQAVREQNGGEKKVAPPPAREYVAEGDNSTDDLRAIAATIWGEARGESREGKIAVGCVIRNRATKPGWWGKGFRGVCLSPHQFSCWWDEQGVRVRTVNEDDARFSECMEVAGEVLTGTCDDPTGGADHYYADTILTPTWAMGKKPIVVIGHHRFFKLGLDGRG